MASVEERLAFVEGRIEEQSMGIDGIHNAVANLEASMNARFLALESRLDARFEAIDRRFEAIDRRFEGVERRIDGLDHKMSSQFMWLIGLYVTGLIATVAALIAK